MKFLILLLITLSSALSWSVPTSVCRKQAAELVLQDLNKNGRLWELHQTRRGETQIQVMGKVWLVISDETFFKCDISSSSSYVYCIDYVFQDPETRRVEYSVQMELDSGRCVLRQYENIVGVRPWQ